MKSQSVMSELSPSSEIFTQSRNLISFFTKLSNFFSIFTQSRNFYSYFHAPRTYFHFTQSRIFFHFYAKKRLLTKSLTTMGASLMTLLLKKAMFIFPYFSISYKHFPFFSYRKLLVMRRTKLQCFGFCVIFRVLLHNAKKPAKFEKYIF